MAGSRILWNSQSQAIRAVLSLNILKLYTADAAHRDLNFLHTRLKGMEDSRVQPQPGADMMLVDGP